LFGDVLEHIGVKVNEGGKKRPQLNRSEHRRSISDDAVYRGESRFVQLGNAVPFGFMRFVFALCLLFALLLAPLLFFFVFLSALRVLAFALGGFFLGFFYWGRFHDRDGVCCLFFRQPCGGFGVMHRAFAVGANSKRSAYVFAVDDDGGFCGIAWHEGLGIGVVNDSFDLADVAELDGPRSLLLGVSPPILDKHKAGMGGNLAVKVRSHLPVIARRVKALVALHVAKQ
jgi:hypothetical protein